jgi:hypothetical protein
VLGGNHDSDLLDGLGKLIRLYSSAVVEIEVFESLHEHLFLGLGARSFLLKLIFKFFFETTKDERQLTYLALSPSIEAKYFLLNELNYNFNRAGFWGFGVLGFRKRT